VAVERTHYLEAAGRPFDLWVMRATNKKQMGEPRDPSGRTTRCSPSLRKPWTIHEDEYPSTAQRSVAGGPIEGGQSGGF
jgi:hypothetical protein